MKKRDLMLLSALIKKHCPTITYDLSHRYFTTRSNPENLPAPLQ